MKENQFKLSQICSYCFFFKGLKYEFETAVVKEPSAFEPLKFFCNMMGQHWKVCPNYYKALPWVWDAVTMVIVSIMKLDKVGPLGNFAYPVAAK